jgi:2-polyprenyl-6-hydroxyphenyl methylase/3-demethylubiquinone-9 3-methyltransferase
MGSYYSEALSGRRLQRCYRIAPPRVKQYLEAEIRYVLDRLRGDDVVLELGCGYGRVALRLAEVAKRVVGIDTAEESIALARELAGEGGRCEFLIMDALDLRFPDDSFEAVVCVQNGVCAFGVDRQALLGEAWRVTREGGRLLFSTYSASFWKHRLAWFEAQADEGLIGRLDRKATVDGVIVCEDGFRAGQLKPNEMKSLCSGLGVDCEIAEVDRSSLFCEIVKRKRE